MKKKLLAIAIAAALTVSMVSALSISASADDASGSAAVTTTTDSDVDIEVKTVFDSWVNYPDEKFGSAYNAGWSYDSENKWINTTQNVGWTGFYNPDITNLTTGRFSFKMKNANFDPCGFTWGMRTGGTDDDPEYSFYAYEECHLNNWSSSTPSWSIAYISSWHPAADSNPHRGPLYHGTIDAADGSYDHSGKDANKVGFAEGEVLAYGTLDDSLKETFHDIVIDVREDEVTVYINGEELTTVKAATQAGSFGPYAVSNPEAFFTNLKMTSTNDVMLNPVFEYRNASNSKISTAAIGETVTLADLSTFEGSEITKRTWTVTKDGKEIYTGTEPYTEYTKEAGIYVTGLVIENAYGISSKAYEDTLTVTKDVKKLSPAFAYINKDGKEVETAALNDKITIKDKSTFNGSPITSYEWTVTRDGKEVYTGAEPYTKYTEQNGIYETTLVIKNAAGDVSEKYSKKLTVAAEVTSPKTSDSRTAVPVSIAAAISGLGILAALSAKKREED